MKKVLQSYPWKGYAVLPHKPSEAIIKKLNSVGIEWVEGTVEDFVNATQKVYGEKPDSAPIDTGTFVVHGQGIDLDRSLLTNIKNEFSILTEEMMLQNSTSIRDFLGGASKTLFPYVWIWDFPRTTNILWSNSSSPVDAPKELNLLSNRKSITDLSQNAFYSIIGIAGSGKSIFANRLAFDWHQTGNPVLFLSAKNASIDTKALDGFMNEIRDKYLKKAKSANIQNPRPIRWLIIADDCGSIVGQIRLLRDHLLATGKPADILLVARESEAPLDRLKMYDPDAIYRLNDTITENDREQFLAHFKRFAVIDEDVFTKNVRDKEVNTSFFALVYSTINDSRKSIKKLLKEEYERLR